MQRYAQFDEVTTGLHPRPIAPEPESSSLPPWLDEALRDPAVVLAGAAVLGLFATALAAILGFLVGALVA